MDLTVREAAIVLARSPRTVRAQLVRGDLPGVKRDGRWRIPKEGLPLTEQQRKTLHAKADAVRAAVESALPPRGDGLRPRGAPSVTESEPFKTCREVYERVTELPPSSPARRAAARLERAVLAVGVAVHQFDADLKLAALNRARALCAEAVVFLVLAGATPDGGDDLVGLLEGTLLPALGRAARRAEGLRRARSRAVPERP